MSMKKQILTATFLLTLFICDSYSQDTLPRFTVLNAGNNKIIIGWVNNFEDVKQISIQRSFDSLSGYKTILTVADPTSKQNGYVDAKATNDHMFYRLYIQRDKGYYVFSKAQRPFKDTTKVSAPVTTITTNKNRDTLITTTTTIRGKDTIVIKRVEPFTVKIDGFPSGDSIATPNPNNYNKPRPNAFTPSLYVYTYTDGYVRISLPDDEKPKKYTIKFFEEDGNFLFELKEIKEKDFKLDKTNFYHAGWFKFELYEDGKLLEKHKFHLDKDF
jgi:hypothetical protein